MSTIVLLKQHTSEYFLNPHFNVFQTIWEVDRMCEYHVGLQSDLPFTSVSLFSCFEVVWLYQNQQNQMLCLLARSIKSSLISEDCSQQLVESVILALNDMLAALLDWDLVTDEAIWVQRTRCHGQGTSSRWFELYDITHYPTESSHKKCIHCSKEMDTISNNTQVGCCLVLWGMMCAKKSPAPLRLQQQFELLL